MLLLSRFGRATPWTAAYQAPPPMGFSRQEYWSRVPLPSPRARWRQDVFPDILSSGLLILCVLCCHLDLESRAEPRPLCGGFPTVFSPSVSLCIVLFMNEALEQQQPGTAYILQLAPLYFPCDKGFSSISTNFRIEPPEVHILPTFPWGFVSVSYLLIRRIISTTSQCIGFFGIIFKPDSLYQQPDPCPVPY